MLFAITIVAGTLGLIDNDMEIKGIHPGDVGPLCCALIIVQAIF